VTRRHAEPLYSVSLDAGITWNEASQDSSSRTRATQMGYNAKCEMRNADGVDRGSVLLPFQIGIFTHSQSRRTESGPDLRDRAAHRCARAFRSTSSLRDDASPVQWLHRPVRGRGRVGAAGSFLFGNRVFGVWWGWNSRNPPEDCLRTAHPPGLNGRFLVWRLF